MVKHRFASFLSIAAAFTCSLLKDGDLDDHARWKRRRVHEFVLVGNINIQVEIGSPVVTVGQGLQRIAHLCFVIEEIRGCRFYLVTPMVNFNQFTASFLIQTEGNARLRL